MSKQQQLALPLQRGHKKSPKQLDREIAEFTSKPGGWMKGKPLTDREIADYALAGAPPAKIRAYSDKLEAKKDRLEAASSRAKREAAAAFGTAHRIGSHIPMGQPILVGHHSERRHRSDIAKIDRSMRKGIEADKASKDLAARAASVGTAGISSDDPEAVKKLKVELNKLRLDQDRMKAGNAAIRKHAKAGPEARIAALVSMGFSEKLARSALEKNSFGDVGFPKYAITNNGANIRRIEKRIAELVTKESAPARASIEGTVDGMTFTIAENKDANRTQITFAGKPSEAVRGRLKGGGFRWAPSEGVWQRQLSNGAWHAAKQACEVG